MEKQIEINKSFFNLNETSLLKSLTRLSDEDLAALHNSSKSEPSKLRQELFSNLTEDEQVLATNVIDQKTFHPEDRLRAFVLGVGESKQEIFNVIKNEKPEAREGMLQRYAHRFNLLLMAVAVSSLGRRPSSVPQNLHGLPVLAMPPRPQPAKWHSPRSRNWPKSEAASSSRKVRKQS